MPKYCHYPWFTTESLIQYKNKLREINDIQKLSSIFDSRYQDLHSRVTKEYIDPITNLPYNENNEYRELKRTELLEIKRTFIKTKKYLTNNNLINHIELLYIIFDQFLNLEFQIGVRFKKCIKKIRNATM